MLNLLFSVSSLLLVLPHSANAVFVKRGDVYPEISSPNHDSVWYSGAEGTVVWGTNNIFGEDKNNIVNVVLGVYGNPISWDKSNPLATDVPIMKGRVQVTIPTNTYYDSNYIIGLFGSSDSPDMSETFTIVNYGKPASEQP